MIDEARNRALCIHPLYQHRPEPVAFDDRDQRDYWQDEVYRYARDLAVREGYRSILDIGCGSGFKLMKYFSGYETIGYEIEPCLTFLRKTYPGRQWWRADNILGPLHGDLVICADVVEHLDDPIDLLQRLARSPLQRIVLSTPALEILAERGESPRLGPPDNESHINEWTTREFRDFCDMHLQVIDHIVVSAKQGTQLILAKPK